MTLMTDGTSRPAELKVRGWSDVGESGSTSLRSARASVAALQLPSLLFPTIPSTTTTVGHLLRDCRKWRKEQRILWKKVRHGCQHRCIPLLFANRKATKAILDFLEQTEVGNRIPERTREEHEEGRDAAWGWGEEAWEEPVGFTRE